MHHHHHREILVGDVERYADRLRDEAAVVSPEELAMAHEAGEEEPPHQSSITAVAQEALRAGRYPVGGRLPEVPGDDDLLRAGDPDADPLEGELSGEQTPGGTASTPDQSNVDDIGRAYGVSDEDGALMSAAEMLERRDAHRWDAEALPPKA